MAWRNRSIGCHDCTRVITPSIVLYKVCSVAIVFKHLNELDLSFLPFKLRTTIFSRNRHMSRKNGTFSKPSKFFLYSNLAKKIPHLFYMYSRHLNRYKLVLTKGAVYPGYKKVERVCLVLIYKSVLELLLCYISIVNVCDKNFLLLYQYLHHPILFCVFTLACS